MSVIPDPLCRLAQYRRTDAQTCRRKKQQRWKGGQLYAYLGANEEKRQKNLAIYKAWVATGHIKRLPEMTGKS